MWGRPMDPSPARSWTRSHSSANPNSYSGTYHNAGTYAITYAGTHNDAGTYSNAGSRPDANTYSRAFACSGDDYTITATGAALRTFHREDRLRV